MKIKVTISVAISIASQIVVILAKLAVVAGVFVVQTVSIPTWWDGSSFNN